MPAWLPRWRRHWPRALAGARPHPCSSTLRPQAAGQSPASCCWPAATHLRGRLEPAVSAMVQPAGSEAQLCPRPCFGSALAVNEHCSCSRQSWLGVHSVDAALSNTESPRAMLEHCSPSTVASHPQCWAQILSSLVTDGPDRGKLAASAEPRSTHQVQAQLDRCICMQHTFLSAPCHRSLQEQRRCRRLQVYLWPSCKPTSRGMST